MKSLKDVKNKKAFTIVEVSILFVIFLIVAFLVAPLSLDDTIQAKNTSRWRGVQSEFENIFYSVLTQKDDENFDFKQAFNSVMNEAIVDKSEPYKITYMNGTFPVGVYRFSDFNMTYSKAVVAYKMYDSADKDNGVLGLLMYDVNGAAGPNTWGKDVFGLNIYSDHFEPFCKSDSISAQKQDCSSSGTGLCCSNYYLIGGNFN